jgi:ureidoglycolate hydrolase
MDTGDRILKRILFKDGDGVRINSLTKEAIKPYGRIIDASCVNDAGRGNSFGVMLKERSRGWRIGYLILREKRIHRLERHPDSLETFEPVKGRAVIAMARPAYPEKVELFFLNKPVVINKNVWHDVLPLSGRCEIKIFENIEVKTSYYSLNEIIVV